MFAAVTYSKMVYNSFSEICEVNADIIVKTGKLKGSNFAS